MQYRYIDLKEAFYRHLNHRHTLTREQKDALDRLMYRVVDLLPGVDWSMYEEDRTRSQGNVSGPVEGSLP